MLGLDEVEAVEYISMLSRDEVLERTSPSVSPGVGVPVEEGIFEDDFDDIPNTATPNNSNANASPSEASPLSALILILIPPFQHQHPPNRPMYSLHISIVVELYDPGVPPFRAEPIKARFGLGSALHGDISSLVIHIPVPADPSHFPPIGTRTSLSNLGNMNVSP